METIHRIVDAIRESRSVLIVSHEGPDGDAVGSSLGLAAFLKAIGKEAVVHLADPVPELYRFCLELIRSVPPFLTAILISPLYWMWGN